ncbi:uncharacterized protein LOC105703436 [Orussus abietinus]|uniref:uncharacterized protein LOC105703436 n=1 Tax=Orussus abietinus TaxID=222816 RepID=UPI00062527ED|nr:uncharacterized protein LOC105703436 [Orussus abietinus]
MASDSEKADAMEQTNNEDGGCGCRLQCFDRISDEMVMNFVRDFNELKTKDEQDMFLQGLIEPDSIKQRKPRKPIPKKRNSNFKYYVYNNDVRIRVCKRVFMSFHGITDKRVRRLCTLLLAGEIPTDKRGRVGKIPKDSNNKPCQQVIDYLEASIF